MKKWTTSLVTIMAAMFLFAGIASAHVVVYPKEVTQGTYQMFSVRVPSEKEGTTTVKVKVTVPAGVDVSRFEPKAGWKYELEKKDDGSIASVTWSADGSGLSDTEFTDFNMQGKVSAEATKLAWKAYQTYADGSVVEWVGAPDADKPASVTTVIPAAADGADAAASGTADQAKASTADDSSNRALTMPLAIAALVLAIAALAVAALRKRK